MNEIKRLAETLGAFMLPKALRYEISMKKGYFWMGSLCQHSGVPQVLECFKE